jgi:hypothetical protein
MMAAAEPRQSVYVVDLAKAVGHAMERVSNEGYCCLKCGAWVGNGTLTGDAFFFGTCRLRTPKELQC